PRDHDVIPAHALPVGPLHAVGQHAVGPATTGVDLLSVGAVGQGLGDAPRGDVVVPGVGERLLGTEAGEGDVQHGGAHLPADAAALVRTSEPGTGAHHA